MLISTKIILEKAKQYGFGVAAPNVINMETVEAAFEAASELNAPIIIDVAELHGVEKLGHIVKYYAEKFPYVVASLNLDHGTSFEIAIKAIKEGYTSVMVDRSTLSFEENVAQVKEIVKIAHAAGISVEAELGHVGQGYEYEKTRDKGLTKINEAVEYVEQTEVDMLAVAIGTSHGTYRSAPNIDFELLQKISSVVDVPLVIHGGSGTGDENLKKAVKMGIQKVNLFTDLSNAGLNAMYEYIQNGHMAAEEKDFETGKVVKMPPSLFNAFGSAKEGYKRMLKHYMYLFESDGKAGLY